MIIIASYFEFVTYLLHCFNACISAHKSSSQIRLSVLAIICSQFCSQFEQWMFHMNYQMNHWIINELLRMLSHCLSLLLSRVFNVSNTKRWKFAMFHLFIIHNPSLFITSGRSWLWQPHNLCLNPCLSLSAHKKWSFTTVYPQPY